MSTTSQELIDMWDDLLKKARNGLSSSGTSSGGSGGFSSLPATISINFDGAGLPPQSGMAGVIELTFPCQIISAHMYAGTSTFDPTPSTATIDVQLSTFSQYGGGGRVSLTGGSRPSMTSVTKQNIDVSGWIQQLNPGDVLLYRLVSMTGFATFISLQIGVRRLDAALAETTVVDSGGNTLTDASGTTLEFRG